MADGGARAALQRLIEERGEDYAGLSRLLGRNPAYVQQFIKRGSPRRLAEEHGEDISGLVLINPSVQTDDKRLAVLPVLSRLVPSFPGISNDIKKPGVDEGAYDRMPLRALHSLSQL